MKTKESTKKTKEVKQKVTKVEKPVTYIVDRGKLTEQLLKDDVSNWIIETGAKMILDGKKPGKNMINFLLYMKIISQQ